MGKRGGGERYDWIALKNEYVTTDITTPELAKKHGIQYKTVSKHCTREEWVKARQEYRKKVGEAVADKVGEKIADNKSDILARVLMSADISSQKIADVLGSGKSLKATEMEHYMNCLESIERMARSIQGILTVTQERKLKLEEERLELEKRKVEQHDVDKDITIRIEGYQGEWSE